MSSPFCTNSMNMSGENGQSAAVPTAVPVSSPKKGTQLDEVLSTPSDQQFVNRVSDRRYENEATNATRRGLANLAAATDAAADSQDTDESLMNMFEENVSERYLQHDRKDTFRVDDDFQCGRGIDAHGKLLSKLLDIRNEHARFIRDAYMYIEANSSQMKRNRREFDLIKEQDEYNQSEIEQYIEEVDDCEKVICDQKKEVSVLVKKLEEVDTKTQCTKMLYISAIPVLVFYAYVCGWFGLYDVLNTHTVVFMTIGSNVAMGIGMVLTAMVYLIVTLLELLIMCTESIH